MTVRSHQLWTVESSVTTTVFTVPSGSVVLLKSVYAHVANAGVLTIAVRPSGAAHDIELVTWTGTGNPLFFNLQSWLVLAEGDAIKHVATIHTAYSLGSGAILTT